MTDKTIKPNNQIKTSIALKIPDLIMQGLYTALIAAAAIAAYHLFFITKIAYVESNKVIDSFTVAIKARQKFESETEQWEVELKGIEDSLNTAMDALKKDYDKASVEKKKELAQRLEKWNGDYARYSRSIEQRKISRENELMQPVIEKINKYMEVWGSRHGYDIIFGTMAGGNIVHANRGLDVTMQAIQDLNEHYE